MQFLLPLQPVIVWSHNAPWKPGLKQDVSDRVNPCGYPRAKLRESTMQSAMQYGSLNTTHPMNTLGLSVSPFATTNFTSSGPANDFFRRIEWLSGRNLEFEEQRSSITFSTLLNEESSLALSSHTPQLKKLQSTNVFVALRRNISPSHVVCGLYKVFPTDTLINEVLENGIVHLEARPRGRWHKVHPGERQAVEDLSPVDSRQRQETHFMRKRMMWTHLGHYFWENGKLPPLTPILHLQCYRENRSMNEVMERISHTIKPTRMQQGFSIPSDEIAREKHACVTQTLSLFGVTKELLPHASRHHNIYPILLNPVRYASYHAKERGHVQYTVLVRNVSSKGYFSNIDDSTKFIEKHICSRINSLQKNGYINYFPVQYFGAGSVSLSEIAAHWLAAEWTKAVRGIIQLECEQHPISYHHYLQCAGASTHSLRERIKNWINDLQQHADSKVLRGILTKISARSSLFCREQTPDTPETNEFARSLLLDTTVITLSMRKRFFCALQAHSWNLLANERIVEAVSRGRPLSLQPGDIVAVKGKEKNVELPSSWTFRKLESEEEVSNYTIFDLVLPVFGVGREKSLPKLMNDYDGERRGSKIFPQKCTMSQSNSSDYDDSLKCVGDSYFRFLVTRPKRIFYRLLRDPNSQSMLKPDLFRLQQSAQPTKRGSWQQFSQRPISTYDELAETQDGSSFLHEVCREPSPLNQSPKQKKIIHDLLHHDDDERSRKTTRSNRFSVVLSCVLPPQSHISLVLRDIFHETKVKSFSDLTIGLV